MKYLFLLMLAAGVPALRLLTSVHDRNEAVAAGSAAYKRGDAAQAAAAFRQALEAQALRKPDPRLVLNFAHAQNRAGQAGLAHATYGRLLVETPAKLGSVARQQLGVLAAQRGDIAQALGLFKQAMLLDPTNRDARFDYEVLSDYLAKRPNGPKIPTPAAPNSKPEAPKPSPDKNAANQPKPGEKVGTDRQGEINDPKQNPTTAANPPAPRADPNGKLDKNQPGAGTGNGPGGLTPGAGAPQPLASGAAPGNQRGLDRNTGNGPNSNGASNRPGTDDATPGDTRLQTQRERLQAMNLSPAQARQLLETLRAQEQQYLQQLTRPAAQKPDPTKPTW
ncbi:MAG: hypothetical protein JWR44_2034 [Hymenobacter sp.]|jgi:tetratricopeptide (TPR) repeat protein|nr:hypothetical protein [Hymenobacter sp.]